MSISGIRGIKLAEESPGIVLVAAGFMIIYFVVGLRSDAEPSIVTYLAIGFGFLVTLAGIALLFRNLGQAGNAESELSLPIGSSDIEQAVSQLGKNYDILRRQATQGFVLAGTFMALGILVILAGSLGEMFGFTKTASCQVPDDCIGTKIGSLLRAREILELLVAHAVTEEAP